MNKKILYSVVAAAAVALAFFLIRSIAGNFKFQKTNLQSTQVTGAGSPAAGESESDYLSAAVNCEKAGDLLKAREAYQKLVEKYPASANIAKAQEALDSLNIKILFSPAPTADSFLYEIQKGDTLNNIAKKFNTTAELISRSNGLKDSSIRTGKKLKIIKAKFSIVIAKSQNILTLKNDQDVVKTYRVSTGKNSSTPVGTFKITSKIIDPPWYPSGGGVIPAKDPRNVLGSRWLGLSKPTYGIHGTIDPESIGKSVTEGCVRMSNADVEELYSIVPVGAEIVIVD